MTKKTSIPSDVVIKTLLTRYGCPTPFGAVRTTLLGNIASPILTVSPLAAIESLWQGHMPTFQSPTDAEELFGALIGGLWNRLAEHQNSRNPFRMIRAPVTPTRHELRELALLRKQELAGFIDGLFGNEDQLMLPEKAHQAVQKLAEAYSIFAGAADLLTDETKPAPEPELVKFAHHAQQATIFAEEHINRVIQSCKRARANQLEPLAVMPTNRSAFRWEADEPTIVDSPLSQEVTRNGVTVNVQIYGDDAGRWILEVVDQQNTSHVWDKHFETDREALDAAICALEEDPMEFMGTPTNSHDIH